MTDIQGLRQELWHWYEKVRSGETATAPRHPRDDLEDVYHEAYLREADVMWDLLKEADLFRTRLRETEQKISDRRNAALLASDNAARVTAVAIRNAQDDCKTYWNSR